MMEACLNFLKGMVKKSFLGHRLRSIALIPATVDILYQISGSVAVVSETESHKMFTTKVAVDPNTCFSPGTCPMTRNSNSTKLMPKFRLANVKWFYSFVD